MQGYKRFTVEHAAGEVLYRSGEPQEVFYIINSGKVQLKVEPGDIPLVQLGKGDFFGEECLNEGQAAMCSAEVVEQAILIKLTHGTLRDMMRQSPEISHKILKKLALKTANTLEGLLRVQDHLRERPLDPSESTDAHPATPPPVAKPQDIIPESIHAHLIIQRSNRVVPLNRPQVVLGRRDYTTGFTPDVDLTKEDEEKYISRKHSLITFKDGRFYLSEETGAINGTFLNGNKLETGVRYELNNGDEITLCHLTMLFRSSKEG